ncbi:hypothetical protein F4860DRAFT_468133, partial [Xylaria cubensis]
MFCFCLLLLLFKTCISNKCVKKMCTSVCTTILASLEPYSSGAQSACTNGSYIRMPKSAVVLMSFSRFSTAHSYIL